MSSFVEYQPLVVVIPYDFGPPIYYSPPEDVTLLFSQCLSAVLLGIRELDEEQISVGMESLKMFFDEYQDRKMLYSGGRALLILPNKYKKHNAYLKKLKEIFEKFRMSIVIKFWDEFNMDYSIALFAIDLRLRSEIGIVNFIMNMMDDIKKWNIKAQEYKHTGVIYLSEHEHPPGVQLKSEIKEKVFAKE